MPPQPIVRRLAALLLTGGLLLGRPASATDGPLAEATVAYVSRDRIYLSAGTLDGLRPGDLLWVERRGRRVARIEITEASDHGAVAILRESRAPVYPKDAVPFEAPQTARPATAPARDTTAEPEERWDDGVLATRWRAALDATPPVLVRYTPPEGDHGRLAISARGETEYRLYSQVRSRDYTRHEQRFTLLARAENLGIEGLELRLYGSVLARYDSGADRYLPGRRAVALIRDVAVTYRRPGGRFFGSIGRFTPTAPIVHTIDGVEAGVDTAPFTLTFFGGLKPVERDLAPTIHHQSFGGGIRLRPVTGDWRYDAEGGVLAELRDGRFCRAALAIDNRVSRGDRFSLRETATLDFIQSDDTGTSHTDFAVSFLGLEGDWRLRDRVGLDLRARYNERPLFAEDVETAPSVWIAALRGDRIGRVEAGLPLVTRKGNRLRPFLFTRGDIKASGADKGYSGGGITYRDPSLFATRTGLTTTVDYGFGTGHLANIDLLLDTPFRRDRLRLLSGLFTTWSWADHSTVHTLRHFLYLILRGNITPALEASADFQATYDHALVRLTYPFGALLQFHVGLTYLL